MPNVAVSTNFGSLPTYTYPGGYDPTKLGLGPLMVQANDAGFEGKWVGPMPVNVARPMDPAAMSPIPITMPYAITWSSTYDWVFFMDNAATSATRRVVLFTFNKTARTNAWTFIGYITLTIPFSGTQGAYVQRGHVVSYEKYTTGTVSINNGAASLTGSGTTWSADRIFQGLRIGFGTTDPTQVTTWYEIASINSDTSITLAGNFQQANLSGASYVIEDLRIVSAFTNGTTASNAGVFMATGLRYELFQPGGVTIAAAASADKVRAVYWLNDGSSVNNGTNQSYGGIALDSRVNWTTQYVYALDAAAGAARFQVQNIRAAMSPTIGRDSTPNTWVFNTAQLPVTGTVSQNSALVLCTPNHGPRSGQKQVFWVTTTRVYSALISMFSIGTIIFAAGMSTETPPGTLNSYAQTNALNTIAYDSFTDRFLIISTNTSGTRCYYTQYREDVAQWDRIILMDNKQINQTIADPTITPVPAMLSQNCFAYFNNGFCYFVVGGQTSVANFVYSIPLAADWEYASTTNCRVVLPAMSLSNFTSLVSGYMNTVGVLGGKTGTNLGIEPSAVRISYRTTGITNNTGAWTVLDYSGDMSSVGIGQATQIQAMLEFRTLTTSCVPGRVARVGFEGTGISSDTHFQFSENLSNVANKQFVWRYSTAFGTTVPTLYARIYDGVTGALLVVDNSVSQVGTWQKCTDGSTWGSFDTSDRINETTYVMFAPYSMSDNVNALPVISLS